MTMKESLFFALLRKALWNSDETLPAAIPADDVKSIMYAANKHAVAGLIANVIIDNAINVGQEWPMQLAAISLQVKATNARVNKGVAELVKLMKASGNDYYVVKGQTLAALYRNQHSRMAGDIDFVVADYDKAAEALRKGWNVDLPKKIIGKEMDFSYNDCLYDLHTYLITFGLRKHRKVWDDLLAASPIREIDIDGVKVNILAPTQYVMYVFLHLFFHFMHGGVGLRHLCDLAIVHHHWKDEIDYEVVQKSLRAMGLYRAYCAFGSIIADKLGLADFPLHITDKDRKWGEIILADVMTGGNFGRSKRRNSSGKWMYKMETMRVSFNNRLKYWRLAPTEVVFVFFQVAWYNLRLIIRH